MAFRIARVKGISIELHFTFILLIAFVALVLAVFEPARMLPVLLMLFFLFASVVFHELAHSLVAIRKGVKVSRVVLLPIGGIAFMEELPEKPRDELEIAIAGPLFNFGVVAALLAASFFVPRMLPSWDILLNPEALQEALLAYPFFALLYVNLVLGAFNLFVPAMPLDGGRIFRSLLAFGVGFARATRIASRIAAVIAIALFFIGFLAGDIMIMIIAAFIYLGSRFEGEAVMLREYLKGKNLSKLISRRFPTIGAGESLLDALKKMQKLNETVLVVREKQGLKFLSLDAIAATKKALWAGTKAGEIAQNAVEVQAGEKSERIATKLYTKGAPFAAVRKGKKLVGLIWEKDLNKLYQITKSLEKK